VSFVAETLEDLRRWEPGAAGKESLEEAFQAFSSTARDLERAYRDLSLEVERLDLEVHEANARLQAVLGALPEGVVAADAGGGITTINPAARRILGLEEEGEGLPEATAELTDASGAPLLLPSSNPEDRVFRTAAGEERRIRVRYVPLSGEGGALWILEDRTELERLEGKVAHLDRLAGLGRMALSIAHEIRNPLNGVAGFAGLLLRGAPDEKTRRYASSIVQGVGRIDSIIRNLLAFARPGSLAARRVDLSGVVEKALDVAGREGIALRLPGEPAWVLADPTAVEQVLVNLVGNAREAGGEEVPLLVSLERRGGAWLLAVEDGGPGIPAEEREAVFEPFHSGKEGGTGLGLSIVKRIVELHGGRVGAADPVELGGARIEVVLPGEADRDG